MRSKQRRRRRVGNFIEIAGLPYARHRVLVATKSLEGKLE
jgi:hypothetical protein